MPIYVNSVPQNINQVTLTIKELINALPENLIFNLNVWLSGSIAKYGVTVENLIFLVDTLEIPDPYIRNYFNNLVSPLNKQATVSNNWKNNNKNFSVKIYNDGKLIIDKETMTYKELPSVIQQCPGITFEEVVNLLPDNIKWNQVIYMTGGVVKNGFSNNDVDFIIFDEISVNDMMDIRKFFTEKIGWKCDVGVSVMVNREPVYLYKIYENGICLK